MIFKDNSQIVTRPSIILLGFIALLSQVVLLREFLTLFNGNELVIGIILANWMLLTGLGAFLGRFLKKGSKLFKWRLVLLGLLSILPLLSVIALHFFWQVFFSVGIMPGVFPVFYYSFIILSPFCIVAGILFTLLSKEKSLVNKSNKIGDVYAWESVGSVIGGLILNLFLIWFLSTCQILFLVFLFVVLFVIISGIRSRNLLISGFFTLISIGVIFCFWGFDIDKKMREKSFPGQEVLYTKDSPFGIFVTTKQNGQINYYQNNVLISSTGDIISKEESVHIAMIQHESPKKVLVLSGIISDMIHEIMKYPVNSIDYVEFNPEIINIAKENLKADSVESLSFIHKDAVRFLKSEDKKYDVVLINIPEPSTIQLNRYYTKEFFRTLKHNLNKDAIVSLSLPSSANYMSDEIKRFLSIIYLTLESEYKNVVIFPLNKDFLIASNNHITTAVAQKIENRNIQTDYVNSFYIDDELLKIRSDELVNQLDENVPLNTDFNPVFYQSQIKMWLDHFKISYWIPAVIILIFSGFFFFKANNIYKGVFAAGFAGTSIEIVLLLVFQVMFGYVYMVVGFFIMIFMGGLALGAYHISKRFNTFNKGLFRKLQYMIIIFSLLLPFIFLLLKTLSLPDVLLFIVFTILLLTISFVTGGIFSVASKLGVGNYSEMASKTYGLDLLGAATGALIFTIYLIPMLGFGGSMLVVGLFNLLVSLK